MKKQIISILMATLMLFVISSINVFAEDYAKNINYTSSQNSILGVDGVLSGYAYHAHSITDSTRCSFTITVTGSWSAYAGLTIKTNFANNVKINRVYLTRPDGAQIGSTFYPNSVDELNNKLLMNVPVGVYTVYYELEEPSTGTIEVWIY